MGTSSYLIAVGSNAPGARRIVAALGALAGAGETISAIHTTRPVGPGGRAYANAAMRIESDLMPPALLAWLKAIEREHGRRPGRRWGPRPLDLDIIGWSGGVWRSRTLTIPHPAFRTRHFVLAPLIEIAPDWRDPVTGLTVRQLRARLDRRRPAP